MGSQADTATRSMSLPTLAAMVIGSMVGAGVFSLPAAFSAHAGVVGALIAWAVAGGGMLMLAFVFQALAVRRPDLDAGVYAYAKAGFGEYPGFFSAFGYWASACAGNTTYWILIMSTLGQVAPWLGSGNTIPAVLLSSAGVWVFFLLVRRGVREAAVINRIVTVAKLVPILTFVVLAIFALDPQVFAANLFGDAQTGSLFQQVTGTMLVTVFVFLGVEGASVYSRYAKRREDVGRATVIGLLSVLCLFASVTIVAYGIAPISELAAMPQPAMAGVLERAVGPWGAVLVSVGLIVSVLGAYLAWSLMSAEVLYVAAKDRDMPEFLARKDEKTGVPTNALLLSAALVQVLLIVTLFSAEAFGFAKNLTSSLSLVPFLLAAGYALKLAVTRETYPADNAGRGRDLLVAGLATAYTAFLLIAAGPKFLLVSFVIYAPATVLFAMTRREQGRRVFSPVELLIFVLTVIGAIAGIVALALGWIQI